MESQQSTPAIRQRGDSESQPNIPIPEITCKSDFAMKVLEKQYLHEKTADVWFVCGPNCIRIPAHKSLLYNGIDAAETILYGEIKDGNEITLPDSPEAVIEFLQFFYKSDVHLSIDQIEGVMSLTAKYLMNDCLETCGNFYAKHLTIENVCWGYDLAITYNIQSLKKNCELRISCFSETIFETNDFLHCRYDVLKHIVKLDSLSCGESVVLGACLNWARNKCAERELDANKTENIRQILKDVLYEIRYGSMKNTDYIHYINIYQGLFTNWDECEDIMRLLAGETHLKTGLFCLKQRSNIVQWNKRKKLCCDLISTGSYTHNISSEDGIVFTSNSHVMLGGLFCGMNEYKRNCVDQRHQSFILTILEQSKKQVFSETFSLYNLGPEHYLNFEDRAIIIKPDVDYCIKLKFPIRTSLGNHGIEPELRVNDQITLKFKSIEAGLSLDSIIECFCINVLEID